MTAKYSSKCDTCKVTRISHTRSIYARTINGEIIVQINLTREIFNSNLEFVFSLRKIRSNTSSLSYALILLSKVLHNFAITDIIIHSILRERIPSRLSGTLKNCSLNFHRIWNSRRCVSPSIKRRRLPTILFHRQKREYQQRWYAIISPINS